LLKKYVRAEHKFECIEEGNDNSNTNGACTCDENQSNSSKKTSNDNTILKTFDNGNSGNTNDQHCTVHEANSPVKLHGGDAISNGVSTGN
jgi:hypothetical protein